MIPIRVPRGDDVKPSRARGELGLCCLILLGWVLLPSAAKALAQEESGGPAATPGTVPEPGREDDPKQIRLFESYIRKERFGEVEPLLSRYVRERPDSWLGFYQLGYVLFRERRIGESVRALARSLQLNLENAEAHKILGLNLTILGKYDEAQVELEQAARLMPDSAEIHYYLGRIYYTKNVLPLAKREFEEALRLDPHFMKAYDNLGLTLEALGDDDGALLNFRRAAELNERHELKSPWPYINTCALYNRRRDPQTALPMCLKATGQDPRSDAAHFETARAYMALKKWDDAAQSLERAIEAEPRTARYYLVLSSVYRRLGRADDAQRALETFQKLSAQEVETFRKVTGLHMGSLAAPPAEETIPSVEPSPGEKE
jgi:tetratricopeptide (TPR) repeat protein